MKTLKAIKQSAAKTFLKKKNVVGTGIGEKWVNGKPTGEQAILVFVEQKISASSVINKFSANDIIPDHIDGVPTDVIEVGIIKKQAFKSKVRPIKPGYSIGHKNITAGTTGGIFLDAHDDTVILSNNHVLANENNCRLGDLIYQPGPIDTRANKTYRDWPNPVSKLPYVGTLKKYVRLNKTNNYQDSAIAKIHDKLINDGLVSDVYPVINKRLTGFGDAKVGTQTQKCGRTTGYTTGRVLGLHSDFSIQYDFGTAKFKDCVVLSNMSKGGDSGSIICDMNMKAVALLFAGSDRVTIANPMDIVQEHYGLKLLSKVSTSIKSAPAAKLVIDAAGTININSPANNFCYYEHAVDTLKSVTCTVNTGTDKSATWGPGLVVQWPNGTLKVNLRKKSFGGYYNRHYNINIGRTRPNTNYQIRIKRTSNTWEGQVHDGAKWYTVIEVPLSIFPHNPVSVRFGKTGLLGGTNNYRIAGTRGKCDIKDITINQ